MRKFLTMFSFCIFCLVTFTFSGVVMAQDNNTPTLLGEYCPSPTGCTEYIDVIIPAPAPVDTSSLEQRISQLEARPIATPHPEIPEFEPGLPLARFLLGTGLSHFGETDTAFSLEFGARFRLGDVATATAVGHVGLDLDTDLVGGVAGSIDFRVTELLTVGPAVRWNADAGRISVATPETSGVLLGAGVEFRPSDHFALRSEVGAVSLINQAGDHLWTPGAGVFIRYAF